MEAGGEAEVSLRIRNTSDIVEEYDIDVVGDPALWCAVEKPALRLYPGTTETVRLTFTPPRGPDPAAGPHPYGVRIMPADAPDAVTVPEGNVSIVPFTDLRAELLPVIVRGWRRAKPRLAVDNFGNTTVTTAVRAEVQDKSVDFETRTPSFQVPPGRAHFSVLTGRPARLRWFGQKVRHPFTTTLIPSGSGPIKVAGTYEQTALLPAWFTRLFAMLFALLMALVALWFLLKPKVTSHAGAAPNVSSSPVSRVQAGASPSPSSSSSSAEKEESGKPKPSPSKPPGKNPPPTPPPPAGYWKLDDGVVGPATTAADSGPGGHQATGQNVTWCPVGGCAVFDGTDSAFTTKGPVLNTGPGQSFTVSAWVWLQDVTAGSGFATAVSQDGSGTSGFYLQYAGGDNCWAFSRVEGVSIPDRAERCGDHLTQTWTHLTGVFDASNNQLQLYVNGKLEGSSIDAAPNVSTGPLVMGRALYGGNPTDWFHGCLKQVQVFGQALTNKQVQTLYQQTSSGGGTNGSSGSSGTIGVGGGPVPSVGVTVPAPSLNILPPASGGQPSGVANAGGNVCT